MHYYDIYKSLTRFRMPLIEKIIGSLNIPPNSKGIDIGCGIGLITHMLSQKAGSENDLIGLDFSEELIEYAERNTADENITFMQGDINNLPFHSGSFDWIWGMDTLWIGPTEYGCPSDDPDQILKSLYKILKPGGRLYLSFWSSQKLLYGHPLLEARLNASLSANAPYTDNMNPDHHIFALRKQLRLTGFKDIISESFVGDLVGPLSENDAAALAHYFSMFWGNSEHEVSKEDWEEYNKYCLSSSELFLPNNSDYYGFYTYTLFQGTKC